MIRGPRVRFRRPVREDVPTFSRWFNDPEVTRHLEVRGPLSLLSEEAWYDAQSRGGGEFILSFEDETGRLIGNIGMKEVDWVARVGEFGIVIGERDAWGKGYGTEAVTLLLHHCFMELGLWRVQLYVDAKNTGAIRCYARCGFAEEGLMRSHGFRAGGRRDDLLMAVLRDDWMRQGHMSNIKS